MLLANVVALASAAVASSPALLLLAVFAAGCATSAIQMLVPVAASLVDGAQRGRIIGNVMSGLMIGTLLSRPIASPSAATLVCAVGLGFVTLALGLGLASSRRPAASDAYEGGRG